MECEGGNEGGMRSVMLEYEAECSVFSTPPLLIFPLLDGIYVYNSKLFKEHDKGERDCSKGPSFSNIL